jgi:hypothetical protein
MPPSYAANPAQFTQSEQAIILNWTRAGAPDWKNTSPTRPQRRFISNAEIIQNIDRDLGVTDADRRKDTRYFTLTHLYNAGVSDTEITAYRDGLRRLLNSLSWEGEIINPVTIDPEQTIFRINLKRYGWKAATWQTILSSHPYNIHVADASFDAVCTKTDCEMPFVRADWFVTHAALPPLYHDILELPSGKDADVQLEKLVLDKRGSRDANQDIDESPGERVWRAGFRKSGVSANNRVVEWHTSLYGYYWKSYDFADVTGFQNIKVHPLDYQRAGGEIIFGLPNGLQGYMLVGRDGSRLDVAPSNIVSNDRSTTKDKNIYNGLSCMSCHTQGMIDGFDMDEVRNAVSEFPDSETRKQSLKIYADRTQMQALLDSGKKRFRDALAKLNSVAGTNEPIVAPAEKFQGDVDSDLAAAELGLSPAKFQEIITNLNDPILNDFKRGTIARKSWEEQIGLVVEKTPGANYVALKGPSRRLTGAASLTVSRQSPDAGTLVDEVLPGVDKSERGHKVAGDKTETGEFASQLWRAATCGGWFSRVREQDLASAGECCAEQECRGRWAAATAVGATEAVWWKQKGRWLPCFQYSGHGPMMSYARNREPMLELPGAALGTLPDGRFVYTPNLPVANTAIIDAWSSEKSADSQLGRVQFPNDTEVFSARMSPSGRQICWLAYDFSKSDSGSELASRMTRTFRMFTGNPYPAVCFVAWLSNTDGSDLHVVIQNQEAGLMYSLFTTDYDEYIGPTGDEIAWSCDSQFFAFIRGNPNGKRQLYVCKAD